MDAFVSYSHKDVGDLARLHVHLAVLRREGIIDAWYDREILAGENIDLEINKKLELSSLFIFLVSPDFLQSDYCVQRELQRALERSQKGEAKIVAIVVQPCDWESTPLRSVKVLPTDGKPVSEWTNANAAWLNVVQEIRRLILPSGKMAVAKGEPSVASPKDDFKKHNQYKLKRSFDSIDYQEFRQLAFRRIFDYFQRSSMELNTIDEIKVNVIEISPYAFGCTIVNRARGRGAAHLTVHCRSGRGSGLGDIHWSHEENAPVGSANGWVDIDNDEFKLFLKGGMMNLHLHEKDELTPDQLAEILWNEMLDRAGVVYG